MLFSSKSSIIIISIFTITVLLYIIVTSESDIHKKFLPVGLINNNKETKEEEEEEITTIVVTENYDSNLNLTLDTNDTSIIKSLTKCYDKPNNPKIEMRGSHHVLYNYIRAEVSHKCEESITYTTHADYSFINNLIPLVERWAGPISVALHAPGTDFKDTLTSILHIRECSGSSLIKKHVTFHLYFPSAHTPSNVPSQAELTRMKIDCEAEPPYKLLSTKEMYKQEKKLLYPVNIGRNIARESAQTHFVLPSDIELYPSLNLIPSFLRMIATHPELSHDKPRVFPIHLFEVKTGESVPGFKKHLQVMLKEGTAIRFHKFMCPACHGIPQADEWERDTNLDEMMVFTVGKRQKGQQKWEPIYIGTNEEPLYEERLSWEGKSDKMTQAYVLCLLNYDFMILNNAFLVHKPGIKYYEPDKERDKVVGITQHLLTTAIYPELQALYGTRAGCAM